MLHPFDDYPVHSTPEPILHVANESPNAYDRFFFNGFSPDGSLFFAVALGLYPNRQVIDGAFSIVRSGPSSGGNEGVQHNVRASGRCPADRTETEVGPLKVEIVEPMQTHRITLSDEHGISADLTCRAASPAIEEPRFTHRVGGRIRMDYTRLTQFCSWQGWIELDGERIEIGADAGVVGVRDRSWGLRPVGDSIPGPRSMPQFYWLWAPTVFDDICTHFALNEEADGRPWHQSGAVVPRLADGEPGLDPGRVQRSTEARADVRWQPGTRWAEALTTRLQMWNAEPVEVTYEPIMNFYMSGVGYRHPEWGHGRWVGEQASTRDRIDPADVDPTSIVGLHVQALSRARYGDREGIGIVEQLIVGPHEPTGLTGALDGFGAADG